MHSAEFGTFVKNMMNKNCVRLLRQAKNSHFYLLTSPSYFRRLNLWTICLSKLRSCELASLYCLINYTVQTCKFITVEFRQTYSLQTESTKIKTDAILVNPICGGSDSSPLQVMFYHVSIGSECWLKFVIPTICLRFLFSS